MKLPVYPEKRPETREGCADMPRPCPFLTCKWHLGHEAIGPDVDDDTLAEAIASETGDTCALDVADRGPQTERWVAQLMGLSHQRVHQLSRDAKSHARDDEGSDRALEIMRSMSVGEDPLLWAHGDDDTPGPQKKW